MVRLRTYNDPGARMNKKTSKTSIVNSGRRRLLRLASIGSVAGALGGLGLSTTASSQATSVRWGIVGTGGIANSMARSIKAADAAEIAAVSSRRMETAKAFADTHGVATAFDSWQEMCEWNGVDAIYVATPTSVREEICLAAANNGKHVLGEKPFASLPSVQRITKACRDNSVAFMDGTHFVHHPRTRTIQQTRDERTGWPWSVASAFQFGLGNRENIRFRPDLEPMGAIGDAGWYNMRAAVEYLAPGVELEYSQANARMDTQSDAVISGSGLMRFDDGSTSTWNCGFDSGAVVMDLRITGETGVIDISDFLSQNPDGSADFVHRKGGWGRGTSDTINVASPKPGSVLMFEDFAAAVANPSLRDHWMQATEATQALLDAAWNASQG